MDSEGIRISYDSVHNLMRILYAQPGGACHWKKSSISLRIIPIPMSRLNIRKLFIVAVTSTLGSLILNVTISTMNSNVNIGLFQTKEFVKDVRENTVLYDQEQNYSEYINHKNIFDDFINRYINKSKKIGHSETDVVVAEDSTFLKGNTLTVLDSMQNVNGSDTAVTNILQDSFSQDFTTKSRNDLADFPKDKSHITTISEPLQEQSNEQLEAFNVSLKHTDEPRDGETEQIYLQLQQREELESEDKQIQQIEELQSEDKQLQDIEELESDNDQIEQNHRQAEQMVDEEIEGVADYLTSNKFSDTSLENVMKTAPRPVGVSLTTTPTLNYCPDKSSHLIGHLAGLLRETTREELIDYFPEMENGGRLRPTECAARQRLAVIFPYRNRYQHLHIVLHNLIPILKRQQVDVTFFVIEQSTLSTFNRGALQNIGFLEAQKLGSFDCYIFHDVDLIPLNDNNIYRCESNPRHFAVALNKFNYRLLHSNYFGGVVGFSREQYLKVNGNSNLYFGWGGEDDDLRIR
ncbi:beta-1 4-galactosyltransferase 4-like isoform X3 [Biomphalaria pfeifferi]|uniref:Beta-1 4-galactosyltransferase 4-like isoform X3 n=1 Tax=Biomphalaria pfeifferi TaxID=112525 RepID=A0AAD8B8X9_BIOPF|nr:beta-1 4-galactosyltransferase 4-like isoform X3 [Biomphalaria pfeifferi]